ncbi:MAG: class I SAM-dependent methyltransferase [Flavobacteriaceae bacterium]|nr:class I SAM-dependent methyltransferase [Flavobacteriaceae bacterium]
MKHLDYINISPISNSSLVPFLECKDHSVSQEKFNLLEDRNTHLLVTSPRPKQGDLMRYYESKSYISHTDTKASFFDKIYQKVRKFTTKNKVKKISKTKNNIRTVLDIGCGTGDFLLACSQKKWKTFGVEPHKKARELAKLKSNSESIYESIENLEESNNAQKFDVITLWHVLEHVPDLDKYTASLKFFLQPDGILIIAVPNYMSFDARYYKSFWAAYDVPRHLWHFSPKAIKILFAKVDIKVINIWPMIFDSFYISLLSEKNKNASVNIFRAGLIGLWSNCAALFSGNYSSLTYILRNKDI